MPRMASTCRRTAPCRWDGPDPDAAGRAPRAGRCRSRDRNPSHDHAGRGVNLRPAVAHGVRLGHRFRRAADEMLRLSGFDPEMRRQIGEIRHHGDVRRARSGAQERLVQSAIEVRDQRDHHVRTGAPPVAPQPVGHPLMAEPDHRLQELQFLRQAEAPAAGQAGVVQILRIHPNVLEQAFGIETSIKFTRRTCHGRPCSRMTVLEGEAAERWPPPCVEIHQFDGFQAGDSGWAM